MMRLILKNNLFATTILFASSILFFSCKKAEKDVITKTYDRSPLVKNYADSPKA